MREVIRHRTLGPCLACLFLLLLSGPLSGQNSYHGTSRDDTIYFGCVPSTAGPGFQLTLVHKIGDAAATTTTFNMNNAALYISGFGGNDHIEAVDNAGKEGVVFASLANLQYRLVYLYGHEGDDTLIGTPGPDRLNGGDDNDTLRGMAGNDSLFGMDGIDFLDAGLDNDYLHGGDDNDLLIGESGNDNLYGGEGDDFLWGWPGDDTLFGQEGQDFLLGDQGLDLLRGGEGSDTLVGGTGDDDVDGEGGTDEFFARRTATPTMYDPIDHDSDWNDSTRHVVEIERILDPYRDWVLMFQWGHGLTYYSHTTSNPQLLLDDRVAGARILLDGAGVPVQTVHKQYGVSCGPSSLATVVDYLGISSRTIRHFFPRDLTEQAYPRPVPSSRWDATAVDAGHHLSTEHIIYEAYHRDRELRPADWTPLQKPNILDAAGLLETADFTGLSETTAFGTQVPLDGEWFQIRYNIGRVTYNSRTGTSGGWVQKWFACGGQAGTGADASDGLPWVANRYAPWMPDAWPYSTEIGPDKAFVSLEHLKAVIRGFIDHNIPLVIGVENGGHFNVLIGYWDSTAGFYVYTADPLDGWGRPFYSKAMRWRRILVHPQALAGQAGVITGIMPFGHSEAGYYGDDGWARRIDERFGKATLCGYLPECALIDVPTLEVRDIRGSWRVVDRRGILFDFGSHEDRARRALAVMQHYGTDHLRTVGRPDPAFQCLLVRGFAPVGPMPDEDSRLIDEASLEVVRSGSDWGIADRNGPILRTGGSRAEAGQALEIMKWYHFTHICFIGPSGPDAEFYYFRR
ncbi:MAG: hypothetical protein AB1486_19445 [Planctomycetota bacterium]